MEGGGWRGVEGVVGGGWRGVEGGGVWWWVVEGCEGRVEGGGGVWRVEGGWEREQADTVVVNKNFTFRQQLLHGTSVCVSSFAKR